MPELNSMSLNEVVKQIETDENIGRSSKTFKTYKEGKQTVFDIPFELIPSQQLLTKIGFSPVKEEPFTNKGSLKISDNTDIELSSFGPHKEENRLIITGKCINDLYQSSCIYLDTSMLPEEVFKEKIKPDGDIKYKDLETCSVAVCHAQNIVLLVDTHVSKNKRAHSTPFPNKTRITENNPKVLLLTCPTIQQIKDETKKELLNIEKPTFINLMYRNLFNAALSKGCTYIVLPAASLEVDVSLPELIKAAKQYPDLKIIHEAGKHKKALKSALAKEPSEFNLAITSKDPISVAQYLTQNQVACAMFNPSSSKVVYGYSDVGENWQVTMSPNDKAIKQNRTFDANIGKISTAPLGSYGINPDGFNQIIARNLGPNNILSSTVIKPTSVMTPQNSSNNSELEHDKNRILIPLKTDTSTKAIPRNTDSVSNPSISKAPDNNVRVPVATIANKPVASDATKINVIPATSTQPNPVDPIATPLRPSPTPIQSNSMFLPSKQAVSTHSLTVEQVGKINNVINQLTREIQSRWPYPNKDLKQIKVTALQALIRNAETMTISKAIEKITADYPRVAEGRISTRTADLLHQLNRAEPRLDLTI